MPLTAATRDRLPAVTVGILDDLALDWPDQADAELADWSGQSRARSSRIPTVTAGRRSRVAAVSGTRPTSVHGLDNYQFISSNSIVSSITDILSASSTLARQENMDP